MTNTEAPQHPHIWPYILLYLAFIITFGILTILLMAGSTIKIVIVVFFAAIFISVVATSLIYAMFETKEMSANQLMRFAVACTTNSVVTAIMVPLITLSTSGLANGGAIYNAVISIIYNLNPLVAVYLLIGTAFVTFMLTFLLARFVMSSGIKNKQRQKSG